MADSIEKSTIVKRDSHQDLIKGIGIILVVVGHPLRGGLSGAYGTVDPIWFFLDFLIYSVHMPLFFFLAGLNSYKSMNKGNEYFKSRFSSLLKPYLVFSVIYFLLNSFMQQISHVNTPIYFSDLLNIWYKPISIMWFLYALFFISVIVYFGRSYRYLLLVLVFVTLMMTTLHKFSRSSIPYEIITTVFFILGYWASKFSFIPKLKLNSFVLPKIIISLVVYFSGSYVAFYLYQLQPVSLLILPVTFVGIIFLYEIGIYFTESIFTNILVYLGRVSLPIYLLHLIPLALVPRLLVKANIYNQINNIILGSIFTIIFSVLIYKLLEKLGIGKHLGLSK